MNHCVIQHNAATTTHEEIRREAVVCPKPRRLGVLSAATDDHPVRSLRWHLAHQQPQLPQSNSPHHLLDIILTQDDFGVEQSCTQIASSPPFFCGSPPSRVANPLIHDARFVDDKFIPLSPHVPFPPPFSLSSSPTSSTRKGGCVRANFGSKPVVRIEGFDCLDRDRRNCSIPTLA